jgi:hypothetical protein
LHVTIAHWLVNLITQLPAALCPMRARRAHAL